MAVNIPNITNYKNINCVNPLYLMIEKMAAHFEEKNKNKYFVSYDADENKF